MRISLEADYAVRIVQCLANDGGRLGAKEISKRTNVTERFTLKILHKLVVDNIVISFKGVGGGYELKKQPQDITLKEVIEIIDGPIAISKCQHDDYDCCDDCLCYFHHVFIDASKEIANKFEKVNFLPKKCNMGQRKSTK